MASVNHSNDKFDKILNFKIDTPIHMALRPCAQVQHCFMAEMEPFKQKFLLGVFEHEKYRDCCLFSDATKVFTEERDCVRHSKKGVCVSCHVHSGSICFPKTISLSLKISQKKAYVVVWVHSCPFTFFPSLTVDVVVVVVVAVAVVAVAVTVVVVVVVAVVLELLAYICFSLD